MAANVFCALPVCLFTAAFVYTYAAQPRSSFVSFDQTRGGGHYAKLFQPPLAFPYNYAPDSKPAESVIEQRSYTAEPPLTLRLSSKRILRPRQFREAGQEEARDNAFLIYVPEEPSTFSNEDASEKQPAQILDNKEFEVAEAGSKVEPQSQSDLHTKGTHRKEHKPKPAPTNTKFQQGGEQIGQSEQHTSSKKTGDKGYKGEHAKHKVEKSQHAEKDKSGHYKDKGGDEKKFDKGEDYQAKHREAAGGQKGTKYQDDGETDEGHATKGTHNVRKKDEYVKKVEFFDEYHEDSDEDEDGGNEDERDYTKGRHEHKGHHDSARHRDGHDHYHRHEASSEKQAATRKHHVAGHHDHHDHGDEYADKRNKQPTKVWKIVVTDKSR